MLTRCRIFLSLSVLMTWSIVAAAAPPLPVKYSGDKHYLIDQNGAPFPILGRTSWFVVSLTTTDYRIYLDDTAARDYNSIEFHIISHDPRGGHPPFDGNGKRTFSYANWRHVVKRHAHVWKHQFRGARL